jgi:hypothetical protein
MSNRSMNLRVANLVADAQNLERLGDNDLLGGLVDYAADRYTEAANTLSMVLCHVKERRVRREAQRHISRLLGKANRLRRRSRAFARSLGFTANA